MTATTKTLTRRPSRRGAMLWRRFYARLAYTNRI